PAAVEVGADVLADGGTAVDAAVAVALAVSVVEPFASGIGGGGSAIVVPPGEDPRWYDYREVVPAGGIPSDDYGVPGMLAGLGRLHEDHGALPWERLVEPAVALARDGHPTSAMLAELLRAPLGEQATTGDEVFRPGGAPLAAGDPLVQPALARALEVVARQGPEAFYDGALAESLTAGAPGLDRDSLASYDLQVSRAPSGQVGGHQVVSAAPALPGVALIQMLQIAEALGVGAVEPGSADYVHQLAAAWDQAAVTVETQLGDPDFVDVPVETIVDAEANRALAEALASGAAQTSSGALPEVGETTHVTIVDGEGLVVSMTNTLTNFWGSGRMVDGYFLNNQMVRFSVGAGGSNTPEPGRRSVSWGMPTVVLDDVGRPVLGIGSPGGIRIPAVLGDVLVRWLLHGQDLQEAVSAPRFSGLDGEIQFEELPGGGVSSELGARGWAVSGPVPANLYVFGSVQAVAVDWAEGTVEVAVDHRREADAVVVPVPE
ncbi:hypothetical protein N869_08170, partial [Cellulomonas bogoriensis 69B4 = DSM 16987]